MTGMVRQIAAPLFSPSAGRIVSAAGHDFPSLGRLLHDTLFNPGRVRAPSGFFKTTNNDMINLHRLPLGIRREDFDSEADYQFALENYDDLYNEAEDIAMEEYYEKKYRND